MRFFLDTEFIEAGPTKPIQLVSIGVVSDANEFYRVAEFDESSVNDWVKANVLPHLGNFQPWPLVDIARDVRDFVTRMSDGSKPEFWGYYADYDWVVFCQMFGAMIDLPKGWPMYCRDLKQWCDELGNPELPAQASKEHNALNDARWNRDVYRFLGSEQAKRDATR